MDKHPTPATRFAALVEQRFFVPLAADRDPERLAYIVETYTEKADSLIESDGSELRDPKYAKARMIAEGARMLLREIAPKRKKGKTK